MTNLYLISENENINTCPKPIKSCHENSYAIRGASHLKSIFDDDPKKCFENAFKKNAFTEYQVTDPNNYIMYMCSNNKYDFFKSKMTKTKYKVLR
jgi:hypothetical protein